MSGPDPIGAVFFFLGGALCSAGIIVFYRHKRKALDGHCACRFCELARGWR